MVMESLTGCSVSIKEQIEARIELLINNGNQTLPR